MLILLTAHHHPLLLLLLHQIRHLLCVFYLVAKFDVNFTSYKLEPCKFEIKKKTDHSTYALVKKCKNCLRMKNVFSFFTTMQIKSKSIITVNKERKKSPNIFTLDTSSLSMRRKKKYKIFIFLVQLIFIYAFSISK